MNLFRCGHCGTVVAFEVMPDRGCPCGAGGTLYHMWEQLTFINVRSLRPPPEDPNAP